MESNIINGKDNLIYSVEKDSIAEELGIEKGDVLLAINNQEVKDVIDYKYLIADEFIVVTIQKKNDEVWEYEIEKEYHEDVGIVFTNALMDKAKSCSNKCIFCFIDQLPKGMRKTLYFKDDDSRLSFLQGNFVSLTNMSEDDINRIIKYRLSPINISVHTTDPDLRVKMMNNKNAGKIYEILKRFSEVGIEMNCQIVLIPDVNDGKNLERTLNDLIGLYPNVSSVAVVPVGVTKYREGLYEVSTYDYNKANELLDFINEKQEKFLIEKGTRFVYAGDEFFVLAKKEIPSLESYEGFPLIEDGIGLLRKFHDEVEEALDGINNSLKLNQRILLITGELAFEFIKDISNKISEKFKGLVLDVVPIKNYFFGDSITVAGLVTGKDILTHLKNYSNIDGIIIPRCMLKSGEDVFLDDVTIRDIEEEVGKKVIVSEIDGHSFVDSFVQMSE